MKTKEVVLSKLNKQEKVAFIDLLRYIANNLMPAFVAIAGFKPLIEYVEYGKICAILEDYQISLGVKDEDHKVKLQPNFSLMSNLPQIGNAEEISLEEILVVFQDVNVQNIVLAEISYFNENLKKISNLLHNYTDFKEKINGYFLAKQ